MELVQLVCVSWVHVVPTQFWLGHSLLLCGHLDFLHAAGAPPSPHYLTTLFTLTFSTYLDRLLRLPNSLDIRSSAHPTSRGRHKDDRCFCLLL